MSAGARFGFEVLVHGDEQASDARVDPGVLVVEGGDEDLGGRQVDVDGALVIGVDADVLRLELGQIDAGDGLAVDDEQQLVSGEEVGQERAGVGAFDDGIERVDDGFKAVKALDLLDHTGDGRCEGGIAAGDEGGQTAWPTRGGMAQEECQGDSSEHEREDEGEEGDGGASTGIVLGGHDGWMLRSCLADCGAACAG